MKKFLLLILVIIFAFFIAIYTYLDVIVERAIEKYGSDALGVTVRVGGVRIGSKFDSITVSNITIANPEGFGAERMMHIGSIYAAGDLFDMLSNPTIYIDSVSINNFTINYQINESGDNNFGKFKKDVNAEHIHGESTAQPNEKKIAIKSLNITNLSVNAMVSKVASKELTLKNIVINDIGFSKGGITVSNALEQVVNAISRALAEANLANLINQLMNIDNLKDAVNPKELIDKGVKDIGNTLDNLLGK